MIDTEVLKALNRIGDFICDTLLRWGISFSDTRVDFNEYEFKISMRILNTYDFDIYDLITEIRKFSKNTCLVLDSVKVYADIELESANEITLYLKLEFEFA